MMIDAALVHHAIMTIVHADLALALRAAQITTVDVHLLEPIIGADLALLSSLGRGPSVNLVLSLCQVLVEGTPARPPALLLETLAVVIHAVPRTVIVAEAEAGLGVLASRSYHRLNDPAVLPNVSLLFLLPYPAITRAQSVSLLPDPQNIHADTLALVHLAL